MHFYCNVFSHVPFRRLREAIHAQEREAARHKADEVIAKLTAMRLSKAAGTRWSAKRYLNMKLLAQHTLTAEIA